MITHWSAGYIGIPYKPHGRTRSGCDCWGLVRLALAAEAGVDVPSYAGDYMDPLERAEVAAAIGGAVAGDLWREVPRDGIRAYDVLVFSSGAGLHVGLAALPGRMLHIAEGRLACLARYDRGPWMHALARGQVWRHRDLPA